MFTCNRDRGFRRRLAKLVAGDALVNASICRFHVGNHQFVKASVRVLSDDLEVLAVFGNLNALLETKDRSEGPALSSRRQTYKAISGLGSPLTLTMNLR